MGRDIVAEVVLIRPQCLLALSPEPGSRGTQVVLGDFQVRVVVQLVLHCDFAPVLGPARGFPHGLFIQLFQIRGELFQLRGCFVRRVFPCDLGYTLDFAFLVRVSCGASGRCGERAVPLGCAFRCRAGCE